MGAPACADQCLGRYRVGVGSIGASPSRQRRDDCGAPGVADVIDLLLAIKGGGHNVAGNAVCEGGVMIDLSGMRSVRVDPVARTARAEGGATWGDFDAETQAFGLATTGGRSAAPAWPGSRAGGESAKHPTSSARWPG